MICESPVLNFERNDLGAVEPTYRVSRVLRSLAANYCGALYDSSHTVIADTAARVATSVRF